ncbi:MAG: GTP 3',8-cyclase MoaA [Oligoflexia bacterium]|nr:GTP 3',8-cyclase MoaA [Oligoflexia bacterium]
MKNLIDSHGRSFRYLRLSVTDKCNFRCTYCLPDGYKSPEVAQDSELSVQEIKSICEGFSLLGFEKVRLTGGEPTIRKDLLGIVRSVAEIKKFQTIALSTNGHNLDRLAKPLREAGITAINVSLDSLDSSQFQSITGSKRFDSVRDGIETALDCGFASIKVNAVLLRDITDLEIPQFFEWVRTRPISVRFIELMKTGKNGNYFKKHHISCGEIQLELRKRGWKVKKRNDLGGPAVEYYHPDYKGTIGLIAPYSEDFCQTCNRLRVSARGNLRLCLFGEEDYSLRKHLIDRNSPVLVASAVRSLIERKPATHYLKEGKYGNTWNLASIGG